MPITSYDKVRQTIHSRRGAVSGMWFVVRASESLYSEVEAQLNEFAADGMDTPNSQALLDVLKHKVQDVYTMHSLHNGVFGKTGDQFGMGEDCLTEFIIALEVRQDRGFSFGEPKTAKERGVVKSSKRILDDYEAISRKGFRLPVTA